MKNSVDRAQDKSFKVGGLLIRRAAGFTIMPLVCG